MRRIFLALFALAALLASSVAWSGSSSAATHDTYNAHSTHNATRTTSAAPASSAEQSADVVLGTFDLAANQGMDNKLGLLGELASNRFTFNIKPPCDGCDITSIAPDLTDTSGNSVNMDSGPMLHHMVLYQQGAWDQTCPVSIPNFGMRRLFASGNERTTVPKVPGYGLYVQPGEQFAMDTDLMNYSSTPQTVQVRVHVTYVAGNTLKPLTPVWLDETGCGFPPSYFDVPAGPSHQTMTWTSNVNGTIVGLGGHLHENGVHIKATDVTTKTPLCDSVESQMDMDGGVVMVTGMTKCVGNPSVAPIHKGDQIQMDSYYDTPQAENGVMGIMIMYVAES